MVKCQRLLVLALAWIFPSVRVGVNGSENPCLVNSSVDLTDETPHSSGLVAKGETVYLPKAIWNVDGKRFGCSCGSGNKKCLRLCCPFDQVQIYGSCVEHNGTWPRVRISMEDNKDEEIVSEIDYFLHNDDPCDFDWMNSEVSEDFSVLENGSIYDPELGGTSLSDFNHYCLFRKPESAYFSAKICRPWLMKNSYWDVFCLAVAALVMLVIFAAYTVVPELDNLHGMMFRSYLTSYVFTYLSAITSALTTQSEDHAKVFSVSVGFLWITITGPSNFSTSLLFHVSVYVMEYWAVSCIFWLNAMSFDIWRAVRCLRSIDSHYQESKKKNYIRYAIYAWVSPAVLITSYAAVLYYVPRFHDIILHQNFRRFCRIGAKSFMFICNTIFYLMTALIIRGYKKDTAYLASGVNKHHDADKQWINVHVKLYLIMGGHMVPWITWDIWPNPASTSSIAVLEMLQGFFLFFVFVWKDNIKRSLLSRLGKTSCQRQSRYALRASEHSTGTIAQSFNEL